MPIRRSETDLTSGQYSLIHDSLEGTKWQVIAHRYNLDFSSNRWKTTSAVDDSADNFGACIFGDYLVHVHSSAVVTRIDLISGDEVTAILGAGVLTRDSSSSITLVDGGDGNLYAYSVSSTGGIITTSSADALTWTDWVDISDGRTDVVLAAGVTNNRVHYIVHDATKRTWRFCVAEKNVTWSQTESDIYWMYPIQSIDAVNTPDGDVLAFISQIPGNIGIKTYGLQVKKEIEPTVAVIAIKYKYNTWSDHFPIEEVEDTRAFRFRRSVRLSYFNDTLFCTATSIQGTVEYASGFYRMYTSKLGTNWSMGEVLPLPTYASSWGAVLLFHGKFVYGCQKRSLFKTYSTLQTGYSPPEVQLDITPYILDYKMTQKDVGQVSLTLDNSTRIFTNHAVVSQSNAIALVHYGGYKDGATNPQVKVMTTEVDYIDYDESMPTLNIKMTARDRMAWMMDKTQSEQSYFWESQKVLGDIYIDDSGTGYGGLKHTATQSGGWKAGDGTLKISSANTDAMSFSSWDPYIWNGTHEVAFKLPDLDTSEYAGLVFRAIDTKNHWKMLYKSSDDKIHLYAVRNGGEAEWYTSAAMGWGVSAWRWLRVWFKYGLIRCYYSLDGISWTHLTDFIDWGAIVTPGGGFAILDKGFVGFAGYGWAPEDNWEVPTWNHGDLFLYTPDLEDEIDADGLEGPDPEAAVYNGIAMWLGEDGEAAITYNIKDTFPTWTKIIPPNVGDKIIAVDWDYHSEYATLGTGFLGAIFAIDNPASQTISFYNHGNVFDAPAIWSWSNLKHSNDYKFDHNVDEILTADIVCHKTRSDCFVAFVNDRMGATYETRMYRWNTHQDPGTMIYVFQKFIDQVSDAIRPLGMSDPDNASGYPILGNAGTQPISLGPVEARSQTVLYTEGVFINDPGSFSSVDEGYYPPSTGDRGVMFMAAGKQEYSAAHAEDIQWVYQAHQYISGAKVAGDYRIWKTECMTDSVYTYDDGHGYDITPVVLALRYDRTRWMSAARLDKNKLAVISDSPLNSNHAAVLRTLDGGSTWNNIYTFASPLNLNKIVYESDSRLFAYGDGSIYDLEDGLDHAGNLSSIVTDSTQERKLICL